MDSSPMQSGSHLRVLSTATAVVLATVFLASPLSPLPSPLSASPPAPAAAPKDAQAAKALLAAGLKDPNTTDVTLAALRLTADADLAPLFAAYAAHSNRRVRLVCAAALADCNSVPAAAALLERAKSDSVPALRAQAVAILVQLKAVTAPQLQEILKSDDENVAYLAARGLIALGQGPLAADKLAELTRSKDLSTAGLSRLDLLGLGRADQLEPAARILTDPNTLPLTAGMMLERIYEDKLAALAATVEQVCLGATAEDVRLHAYRALSVVSADAPRRLLEALGRTEKTPARVLLFRMVAGLKDAAPHLKALADGNGLVGALARFELARPAMDAAAAQAASEAAAYAHPIVLEHLLSSLREDLAKAPEKLDYCTPALLDIVRKAPQEPGPLRSEQEICARAATLLGDLGSPAALEGLRDILSGPFGESKRAAVGGLVRTKNPAAAALLKPLLDSPYAELAATSAIALARHGEKAAARTLQDILVHPHRYSPDLLAMVAWYALKLSGEHTAALTDLIQAAK